MYYSLYNDRVQLVLIPHFCSFSRKSRIPHFFLHFPESRIFSFQVKKDQLPQTRKINVNIGHFDWYFEIAFPIPPPKQRRKGGRNEEVDRIGWDQTPLTLTWLIRIYRFLILRFSEFPITGKKNSHISCPNFCGESSFPGSSQISFSFNITCVFPNPYHILAKLRLDSLTVSG